MSDHGEFDRLQHIAQGYAGIEGKDANYLYHLSLRNALIPEEGGTSALEIGCGDGMWTEALCDRYDSVDVVEASIEFLSKTREHCKNRRARLTTHNTVIEDFVPPVGTEWQHIFVTFLIEHLIDPVATLRKLKDYLQEDGRLFVAVPNAASVHRIVAHRMGLIATTDQLSDNDLRVGHRRVYTIELLRKHVQDAGYRVVEEKSVGLKVLSLVQMNDWPIDRVCVFCESGDLAASHGAYLAMVAADAGV